LGLYFEIYGSKCIGRNWRPTVGIVCGMLTTV